MSTSGASNCVSAEAKDGTAKRRESASGRRTIVVKKRVIKYRAEKKDNVNCQEMITRRKGKIFELILETRACSKRQRNENKKWVKLNN